VCYLFFLIDFVLLDLRFCSALHECCHCWFRIRTGQIWRILSPAGLGALQQFSCPFFLRLGSRLAPAIRASVASFLSSFRCRSHFPGLVFHRRRLSEIHFFFSVVHAAMYGPGINFVSSFREITSLVSVAATRTKSFLCSCFSAVVKQ
jgi:hypothetical protein